MQLSSRQRLLFTSIHPIIILSLMRHSPNTYLSHPISHQAFCFGVFANRTSTLWENLKDEIQHPKEVLQSSSSEEDGIESAIYPDPEVLIIGHGTGNKDLSLCHPPPIQIFRLWQTFLVNINPLVKIIHAPTIQQLILDATSDLSKIHRDTEALMFGIYFLAVTSMRPDECLAMCGDSRSLLLQRFSHALQQALINAKFLKSLNIMTLQAYVFYLVSV
jgi:hypothetical protein